jgi:hypothetical protein
VSTLVRGLRSASKSVDCGVISEQVVATLRRRVFGEAPTLFVQCSERDCQYVDSNRAPCPLSVDLFAAELRELSTRRARPVDR